ncbi:hypothetical protein E2C01_073113 [Portunus trituberculatus]|uniref:Uncharacterized protein n=1 Tax=Portunus trituberculatus TaxID=210409 RepID=A0A5B7HZY2_PORTR|nr:hypothetical protein [Portunus trituberculatus]
MERRNKSGSRGAVVEDAEGKEEGASTELLINGSERSENKPLGTYLLIASLPSLERGRPGKEGGGRTITRLSIFVAFGNSRGEKAKRWWVVRMALNWKGRRDADQTTHLTRQRNESVAT